MKKGLLLSIVASTFVFAGGDIVPMEPAIDAPAPAVPAPVAKCGNFSGSIGAYYRTTDGDVGLYQNVIEDNDYYDKMTSDEKKEISANLKQALKDNKKDMFDKEVSKFDMTAAIAMEKQFGYGVTLGVEVAGWRDSHDIADNHRVSGATEGEHSGGELSQLWIAKSFGNTAVKFGRQALPKSLMPFEWTDSTAGVKDTTYEGVVFANTSMKNTTIYGGWIGSAVNGSQRIVLDKHISGIDKNGKPNYDMENGLFALGFRTTALWNLGLVGFYAGDHKSVWGDVSYQVGGWDAGIQGVWSDDDGVGARKDANDKDMDATMAAAAKFGKDFGKWDAKVVVSYIAAGNSSLKLVGDSNDAFWGDLGDNDYVYRHDSKGIGGVINVKNILNGKVYLGAGYMEVDTPTNDALATATVGYKTTVAGFGVKAEYKYYNFSSDIEELDGGDGGRVTLEAVYKF